MTRKVTEQRLEALERATQAHQHRPTVIELIDPATGKVGGVLHVVRPNQAQPHGNR